MCKGYSAVYCATVYLCLMDVTILKCSYYRIEQEELSGTCPPGAIGTPCSACLMLGWMTVQQLIPYHTVLFTVPRTRALSRDNYRGNIVVENSRLGLFKKSFIPRGSTLPNSLPKDIRRIPKLGTFKKELRKWIMDNINRF